MKITIKILKGAECTVEVPGDCTVLYLKNEVEREMEISPRKQKLVYKGRSLHDDKTLADCGIVADCKLFLVVKKDENPNLFDLLYPILCKHFTASDASKVMGIYKNNFDEMITNLSLDDIERLATANIRQQEQL